MAQSADGALMDDLVEEVLLRFPPGDPASLARAARVCKRWRLVVSDAGFRRRFLEFHRTHPMLGFFFNHAYVCRFVSATSFRPPQAYYPRWHAIDARHGRVLVLRLISIDHANKDIAVWDPLTGDLRGLPMPRFRYMVWNAALLCAATASCDHLDCHRGPFRVVFVGTDILKRMTFACVYSSDTSAWSKPISVQHHAYDDSVMRGPCTSALVGNALYFVCSNGILEHHFGKQELLVIGLPSACKGERIGLMKAEDGALGLATVQESRLYIWSRDVGLDSDTEWELGRVIKIHSLLPACALSVSINVIAIADGVGVIFMMTSDGIFTLDLKSGQVRKVADDIFIYGVVPFISFCTPALGAALTGEGPRLGASTTHRHKLFI